MGNSFTITEDVALPYCGMLLPVGSKMLEIIKKERDYLNTVVITAMRRAGLPVRLQTIWEVAAGRVIISGHPIPHRKITCSNFLTYKGRRVSIEEGPFFIWDGKTEEGRQLRALLDKENPELWGHFARQAALVPDPEIVYRDFNAKAYRDITIHVDLSPDYERSLEPLESKNYFEKEGS